MLNTPPSTARARRRHHHRQPRRGLPLLALALLCAASGLGLARAQPEVHIDASGELQLRNPGGEVSLQGRAGSLSLGDLLATLAALRSDIAALQQANAGHTGSAAFSLARSGAALRLGALPAAGDALGLRLGAALSCPEGGGGAAPAAVLDVTLLFGASGGMEAVVKAASTVTPPAAAGGDGDGDAALYAYSVLTLGVRQDAGGGSVSGRLDARQGRGGILGGKERRRKKTRWMEHWMGGRRVGGRQGRLCCGLFEPMRGAGWRQRRARGEHEAARESRRKREKEAEDEEGGPVHLDKTSSKNASLSLFLLLSFSPSLSPL